MPAEGNINNPVVLVVDAAPPVDDVEVLGAEVLSTTAPNYSNSPIIEAEDLQSVPPDTEPRQGGAVPIQTSPSQHGYPQHEGSFSISYKAYLRAMSCALVNMLPFPWRARQPRCVLLGRRYDFSDLDDHEAFKSDFTSRMLFTYRHGFAPLTSSSPRLCNRTLAADSSVGAPPLAGSSMNKKISSFFRQRMSNRGERGLTSDSGWGCMIRVFQMALGQVLMHIHFGRDWRRPQCRDAITIQRRQVLLGRSCSQGRRSYSFDSEWPFLREPQPTTAEILSLLNHTRSALGAQHRQHNSYSMPLLSKREMEESSPEIGGELRDNPSLCVYPWNLLPILTLFRDVPTARFSLHRIVAVGRIGLGIKAGAWFGPTSCSDSMAVLIAGSSNLSDLPGNTIANQKPLTVYPHHTRGGIRVSVYHSKHGEISRNRVQRLFRHSSATPVCSAVSPNSGNDEWHLMDISPLEPRCSRRSNQSPRERSASLPPSLEHMRQKVCHNPASLSRKASVLSEHMVVNIGHDLFEDSAKRPQSDAVIIFLSFRLGLDSFNMRYQPFLQSCFGMPQFQGLAGGGPLTSAYWFVAANDEHLYFLDPHSPVQPALQEIEQCVSICGCPSNNRKDEPYSALSSPEAPARPSWLKHTHSPAAASDAADHQRRTSLENANVEGWNILPGLRINNQTYSKETVDQMFFPSAPKQLNWRALNPSMTLVFLCQSFLTFEDLLLRLSEVDSEGLISVVEDEGFGINGEFGLRKNGAAPESRNLSFDSAEDGFYLL